MTASMKRILIPLPDYGFDPTEVAIPWKLLGERKIEVIFATPRGSKGAADRRMLTGEDLGIWTPVLRARSDAVAAYYALENSESFRYPLTYAELEEKNFDAILLPGGHDKDVREYLESEVLQRLVVHFFSRQKPVAAICHGVVLAARSRDAATGASVIHQYKTTSLLKSQELLAFYLTRLWLGTYYRTYPKISVEDEVRSALSDENNFIKGSPPLLRDSLEHLDRGFIVRDRNYLSARWPGDVYRFSLELIEMICAATS